MAVSFHSRTAINLHNSTPVFNKRIFKAQAGIVLTEEILAILHRPLRDGRSKTDLHKLKSVVNGLKDIHKGLQFIKDALCYVVGYEKVAPNVEVKKQATEADLSCYYVLNGSIEASYVISNGDSDDGREGRAGIESLRGKSIGHSRRIDGYEISYTHIAGDYLGLVSGDGPEYDLPPPQSIKTIEVCEFLRIDREKFHQAVRTIHSYHVQEIEHFINSGSILKYLPLEERQRLVPLMAKQEYAAGKVIVNQGDFPDHIFFVGKGRCQFFRRVYIKEAKRLELVKLGQIEKGDVFGEACVLHCSPCFCSVSSIGQVTCYLINKWAIKNNEHVLSLLRDHQHYFHEDSMIQRFIRDSDVWQSYKRSKITGLLEATNKQHIVIEKKHVPETLAVAVGFGDANRSHSSQSVREREAGEPARKQPLFIVPRSRRRSSAILQSNAAAVVKAVLLLRRSATDVDEKPLRLPEVNPKSEQQSRIKPNSAPSRYRPHNTTTADYRSQNTVHSRTGSNSPSKYGKENVDNKTDIQSCGKSPSEVDKHSKKKQNAAKEERRPKSVNDMYSSGHSSSLIKNRPNCRGTPSPTESKSSKSKRVTILDVEVKTRKSSNSEKGKAKTKTKAKIKSQNQEINVVDGKSKGRQGVSEEDKMKTYAQGMEKYVSTNSNFIVKEIINTGNPKRSSPPQGYQRFGVSMFAVLDNQKEIEDKNQGPNPWGVSYAASKWMTGIRKKRLRMRNESDRSSASPVPTPLIVIEEYVPEKQHNSDDEDIGDNSDYSSEELDFQSEKEVTNKKKVARRSISTPSPSLEQLTEENEDEIKEYDKHEAGKAVEERQQHAKAVFDDSTTTMLEKVKKNWYTPIHEARDQSRSHLDQIRKELERLRYNREKRRRRYGNHSDKDSLTTSNDQVDNDVKNETTQEESKDDDTRDEESLNSSSNHKLRQRKHSTRKRSRAFSTSTAPDSQALEWSSKSSGSSRMRRKYSNVYMRNTAGDQGNSRKLGEVGNQDNDHVIDKELRTNEDRTGVITKHERRRLLLLEKIGL